MRYGFLLLLVFATLPIVGSAAAPADLHSCVAAKASFDGIPPLEYADVVASKDERVPLSREPDATGESPHAGSSVEQRRTTSGALRVLTAVTRINETSKGQCMAPQAGLSDASDADGAAGTGQGNRSDRVPPIQRGGRAAPTSPSQPARSTYRAPLPVPAAGRHARSASHRTPSPADSCR
jgi:hypothetical protein